MADAEKFLARLGIAPEPEPPPTVEHHFDPALIPDIDDRPEHPLKTQIHAALGPEPIVTANNRWGRSPLKKVSRDESNKVRCPNPAHPDDHESAWICISKNIWACAVCANTKNPGKYGGGDVFSLAGYHFGLDPVTQFVELLERMASDLGLALVKRPSGISAVPVPTSVTSITEKRDEELPPEPEPEPIPEFPLEAYPPGTLAWHWCNELENQTDWHPNFIRPLALLLLGSALREQVYYLDDPCVTAKFHMCLLGETSTGKSRPIGVLRRVLEEVMPFDPDTGGGILQFEYVGSGEALLEKFAYGIGTPPEPVPVAALWPLNELQDIYTHKEDSRRNWIIALHDWFRHTYKHDVRDPNRRFISHHPFCQIITTSQPDFLHEYLSRKDVRSGSLGRWFFAAANKSRTETRLKTQVETTRISHAYRDLLTWTTTERVIDIDAKGTDQDAFARVYEEFKSADIKHESPVLGRSGLNVKKIVTALCGNDKTNIINEDIAERTRLIMPFFLQTAQLVDTKLNFSEETDYQDRILAVRDSFYKAHNRWPSQREVAKNLGARYSDKRRIIEAYKVLEQVGELLLFDPPQGEEKRGRPRAKLVLPGSGDKTEVRG